MATLTDFVLLPAPRRRRDRPGLLPCRALREMVLRGDPAALYPLARRLRSTAPGVAENWPIRVEGAGRGAVPGAVTLELDRAAGGGPQGYRLVITPAGIRLSGAGAAGLFYGIMTLAQLWRQSNGALPAGEIADSPDFPTRGVMLDISRDKVPTLDTLFALVDQLAEWKINHLELYTEHTFAYRRHREVWVQASPMTGEDILRLDAYCRDRFIELVPNQNSFGHLERWLKLPAYRPLAEAPGGFDLPWGGRRNGPFSLDPANPGSLRLIEELYDELLPHFTSGKFNVGCDETFDLGQGKSRALCERKGKGRVYLDFLLKIHRLVRRRGRAMHFWGDIILHHPELVRELPKDIVALEWGYEANHPFAAHGATFSGSGVPFYVCPGTSSWNAIAGRTDNCLGNLDSAARHGLKHGAIGFLNTDWGDNGHWQYLPVSLLGFAAGAACAWCHRANDPANITVALDRHVFHDSAGVMGTLAHDLGNAYRRIGHLRGNSTVLFQLLHGGAAWKLPDGVTVKTLRATQDTIAGVMASLPAARMGRPDADLIGDEFLNAARMMLHACRLGLAVRENRLGNAGERRRLAGDMRIILGEHRRLWMARNREGGLQDSARALERRLAEYEG